MENLYNFDNANIPAIAGSDAIVNLYREMRGRFDLLNNRIKQIERTVNKSQSNSVARIVNTGTRRADSTLEPIPNFPATPGELESLSDEDLTRYSKPLGSSSEGTLDEKIRRLMIQAGNVMLEHHDSLVSHFAYVDSFDVDKQ